MLSLLLHELSIMIIAGIRADCLPALPAHLLSPALASSNPEATQPSYQGVTNSYTMLQRTAAAQCPAGRG